MAGKVYKDNVLIKANLVSPQVLHDAGRMRPTRKRVVTALSLGAALVPTVAGCGNETDDKRPARAPTPAQKRSQAPPPTSRPGSQIAGTFIVFDGGKPPVAGRSLSGRAEDLVVVRRVDDPISRAQRSFATAAILYDRSSRTYGFYMGFSSRSAKGAVALDFKPVETYFQTTDGRSVAQTPLRAGVAGTTTKSGVLWDSYFVTGPVPTSGLRSGAITDVGFEWKRKRSDPNLKSAGTTQVSLSKLRPEEIGKSQDLDSIPIPSPPPTGTDPLPSPDGPPGATSSTRGTPTLARVLAPTPSAATGLSSL